MSRPSVGDENDDRSGGACARTRGEQLLRCREGSATADRDAMGSGAERAAHAAMFVDEPPLNGMLVAAVSNAAASVEAVSLNENCVLAEPENVTAAICVVSGPMAVASAIAVISATCCKR